MASVQKRATTRGDRPTTGTNGVKGTAAQGPSCSVGTRHTRGDTETTRLLEPGTLDRLIDAHVTERVDSGAVGSFTAATNRDVLRAFARWYGSRPLTDMSADLIREYVASNHRLAERTRAARLGALRRFTAWLATTGHVADDPCVRLSHVGLVRDENDRLIAAHARWQTNRALSTATISVYAVTVRNLAASLEPRPLTACTRQDIERWLETCTIGPTSRAHYLSRVHAFYEWAIDYEHLAGPNPAKRIRRPERPKQLPRPISEHDLAYALANCPDRRVRAWIVLAAYAGLRCKEIAGIQREDIRDDGAPVLIVSAPKGRRQRAVPLRPEVMTALAAYGLRESGPLFLTATGQRMNPHVVSDKIAEHLKGLGIAATAHSCRHRFGTVAYRHSLNLRAVQELLGHASPTTTAIYTHVSDDDLAATVAGMPETVTGSIQDLRPT